MSLLTDVIGGLLRGSGSGSAMQGVLQELLAGGQRAPAQPGQGGGLGGLSGLVSAFEQAGLGNVVQSWISSGPNQPVSPEQLQNVLGQDRVQSMAQQAGLPPHSFLSELSQHLPKAVDQVTPQGRLPDEGTITV
ncbi:MAG: DUF937 domain-containing protein [Acetobacteraceae bacterium]|nr:DUF937 domain-containing protein [Acetobacteraceae bacterium]